MRLQARVRIDAVRGVTSSVHRLRRRAFWLAALLVAVVSACGQPAGKVSFKVDWLDGPPDDVNLLSVSVLAPGEDGDDEHVAASASAATLGTIDAIALEVPNGSGLVLAVEVLESAAADARVLQYGRSLPFDVRPGSIKEVSLDVAMRRTPNFAEDGGVDLKLHGSTLLGESTAEVLVKGFRGTELVVAGDPAMVLGRRSYEVPLSASQSEVAGEAEEGVLIEYDLDDACTLEVCPDGERVLYFRLFNGLGYSSKTVSLTLGLDRVAPEVVPGSTSYALFPPEFCPLSSVEKLGLAGRFEVLVAFSEPLASPPEFWLGQGETRAIMDVEEVGGTVYRGGLQLPFESELSDGPAVVSLLAEDFAGHIMEVTLGADGEPCGGDQCQLSGAVQVDTTAPVPPARSAWDQTLDLRYPWGAAATEGKPLRRVDVMGDAFNEAGTVVVRSAPMGETIIDARPFSPGVETPIGIEWGGQGGLYVQLYDGACNASDATLSEGGAQASEVRQVRWIATMAEDSGGGTDNPHKLFSSVPFDGTSPRFGDEDVLSHQAGKSAVAGFDDGAAVEVSSDEAPWHLWQRTDVSPQARSRSAAVLHEAFEEVVVFGGESSNYSLGDT